MKIESFLDVDVVAVEMDEQVSLLLELTAPTLERVDPRPPATLVVVLDRSGSMAGDRLEVARRALCDLVEQLDPADRFGLVTFDDVATVDVPAGPLTDKAAVLDAIRRVEPGGMTDLAAGYLRGLQEIRRVGGGDARLVLVSDGHANRGVTDHDALGSVAAKASRDRVTTTTLGLGLGYDEELLGAIATSGNGAELFAEEADAAAGLLASEVDGLLEQSVTAASLLVRPSPAVASVLVVNDLPSQAAAEGILVELGGFVSGQFRKVVLTLTVPGIAALGPVDVAQLDLRYVTVPALVEESVTIPVQVNVVPGEEAAQRQPNPVVRTELAFQHTQTAKREASRHLQAGDVSAAASTLHAALDDVHTALAAAPPELVADLAAEADMLTGMVHEAEFGSTSRASKHLHADASMKSRRRE